MSPLRFAIYMITSASAGATLATVFNMAGTLRERLWPLIQADPAGWVQAVGSILAIASGFVLASLTERGRARAERRRDHEAMSRAVECLLTEIRTSWANASEFFDKMFNSPNDHKMRAQVIVFAVSDSPIFASLIPQLAALPDERIRSAILQTYAAGQGLGVATEARNECLRALGAAQKAQEHDAENFLQGELTRLNDQLKRQVKRMADLVAIVRDYNVPPLND